MRCLFCFGATARATPYSMRSPARPQGACRLDPENAKPRKQAVHLGFLCQQQSLPPAPKQGTGIFQIDPAAQYLIVQP